MYPALFGCSYCFHVYHALNVILTLCSFRAFHEQKAAKMLDK